MRINGVRRLLPLLLLLALSCLQRTALAASPPIRHLYAGHLYAHGSPVTTSQAIRFSLWKSGTMADEDRRADGTMNDISPAYGGWKETQTITPDANGYFAVQLGNVTPIDYAHMSPDVIASLFLQVDVKPADAPSTAFETLDVLPSTPTIDRTAIASVPFASNANLLDQHGIGANAGDIPVINSGGKLSVALIPSGIDTDAFTIDANGSATGAITLKFGDALGKKLSYDTVRRIFTFNDAVRIEGSLTVAGLVNGIDLQALAGRERVTERVFHAAYPDAAMKADGTNNVGQLTLDNDAVSGQNFYRWSSTRPALQDYDVVVRISLPPSFARWGTPAIRLMYRTETADAADNSIDGLAEDETGNALPLTAASTELANINWTTVEWSFAGNSDWQNRRNILLRFRLHAKDAHWAQIGDLLLQYSEFP